MVDILIDGDHKQVMAIPAVQRYFTSLWHGFYHWSTLQTLLLYVGFFFFPPFWLMMSLPFASRLNHAPLVKLATHVVSHLFFMLLLLLVFAFPLEKIYDRHGGQPNIPEILLLTWIVGIVLDEFESRRIRGRFSRIRMAVIFFSISGVLLHVGTFAVSSVGDLDSTTLRELFFLRNFALSLALFMASLQIFR